jgi:pimeloyl-ACP methyl ester carboxylesterase
MPILNRGEADIYYEDNGDGARGVVTLVNGHTRSIGDFKLLGANLVDRGWRVLAIDNRGAGKTVYKGGFTIEMMADDVVAVWDSLDVPKSSLLGISMGGFISQVLASRYPTRINRLILVSTTDDRSTIKRSEKPWTNNLDEIEEKLAPFFAPAFLERNKLLIKAMAKQILKAMDEGQFNARSQAQREATMNFDGGLLLDKITADTLIVHGEEDQIISVEGAKSLAQKIPRCQLAFIPGGGHLLLAEKPRELYGLVGEFLDSGRVRLHQNT